VLTGRSLRALTALALTASVLCAACSSDEPRADAPEADTAPGSSTTTTTPPGPGAAGPCQASDTLTQAATAADPDAVVDLTDRVCSSVRAVATITGTPGCEEGCAGFFAVEDGSWRLVDVRTADDLEDLVDPAFGPLAVTWRSKYRTDAGGGIVSGGTPSTEEPVPGQTDTTLEPLPT
jgi:hypothetical protein